MDNITRFFLILLTTAIVLLGCNSSQGKEESKSSSSQEKVGNVIPPKPSKTRVSETVPYLECLVNNDVFESSLARGNYIIDEPTGKVLIDLSAISGNEPGKDYVTMIGFTIEEFKGPGKYTGNKTFYYKQIEQGNPKMLEWESTTGSLNITDWDEENKIISGTFSTTVKNEEGKKIKIDGGRFKNVSLELLIVK